MMQVDCPMCGSGEAEVTEVQHQLEMIIIKCEHCNKEYFAGIRDWEVECEREI